VNFYLLFFSSVYIDPPTELLVSYNHRKRWLTSQKKWKTILLTMMIDEHTTYPRWIDRGGARSEVVSGQRVELINGIFSAVDAMNP
jgi:hypothetical protein